MLVAILVFGGEAGAAGNAVTRLFSVVGTYPLGARVNRTDYESIDPVARRLYVSKMGGGQLLVFDIVHNKLVAALNGFPKVTGTLVVPALHKVYASVPGGGLVSALSVGLGMAGLSSGHGQIVVVNTQTLKETARLPGGVFPDGLAYDPNENKIFASDELGSAVTVIDADTNQFSGRIGTGGEVGNVRYDAVTGMVYVPVQSHDELIAIDPVKMSVIARYHLAGCDHPHGFIIAPDGKFGYIACDANDKLLTVELATGHVLKKYPVAHDPDVLAVDVRAHRLYVAAESGYLSTYDIAVPQAPSPLGDVFVAAGAHAVAVDPVSHRLYLALANLKGHAALRVLAPNGR